MAVTQACEAQDEHEGEGVSRHQRVKGGCKDEAERGAEKWSERGTLLQREGDG